ncbi:MAG TPA: ABC transporter ATP-binding protein/permease [Candidatus Eisenbergiella merdavium]|uniref:ABC transporter ATP-binding protein/permease n=1 Tax=Candidatus Eisenbergiella merdavium TaxID=2838551 RepID=A0A9D2SNN9_9FIRM|nr:ABC transporter ATP-binding protein/permease [Candidatus Eisenbergiella merdavium]
MKRKGKLFPDARKDIRVYLRMIRLLNRYNPGWLVLLLGVLMDGALPFVAIWLSSLLLDALYAGRPVTQMMALALAGAGVSLVMTALKHFSVRQKNVMWWGMQHRMAEPLMRKTMEMDYALTENARVRALRARQDEYRKKERDVFERFLEQLELLLAALVRLIFSVITVWPFFAGQLSGGRRETALFTAAAAAALLFSLLLNHWSVRKQGARRQAIHFEHEDENRLNTYMMDEVVLSNEAGKDIRIFHQQRMMESYGEQMNRNWRRMTRQYAANDIRHFGLQGLLSACMGGIVYLYVAFCAWAGSISTGSVVRYAGAVWQFIQAATDLSASWNWLHHDRMQMDEYLEYLDLKNEMKKGTIPVEKRKDGRFLVEFRNVSFRYPGSERYALRNLNVRLNIGERMALVGRNGSGKTTFVKLLCRLYDPTEGTILLNGVDIRKYDEQEYRRLFSVVFQDFQIFSFSMGENIAGSTRVDEERAMDAIRRVGLEGLYRKLPEGLRTMLNRDFSDTGMEISGGEAQKTAMARAIYKDAPFVILDEPTAALDPIAENEIYTGFHEIIGKKTALFISHRLSACRFSREILVFENGNVVQQGSHETLAEEEGLYRKMWQAQAQYYR